LFPWANNFTPIAKYWLVPKKGFEGELQKQNCLFHNQAKINQFKLTKRQAVILYMCYYIDIASTGVLVPTV